MKREAGQALVEATLALPVCIACSLALVDAGLLVRDRIATSHAATRAAEAHLAGSDPRDAARAALPASLRQTIQLQETSDAIVVRTSTRITLASFAGQRVQHRSRVDLAVSEVLR